jgi:hypothetical protein
LKCPWAVESRAKGSDGGDDDDGDDGMVVMMINSAYARDPMGHGLKGHCGALPGPPSLCSLSTSRYNVYFRGPL